MPQGPGTYGSKRGRPPAKKKKGPLTMKNMAYWKGKHQASEKSPLEFGLIQPMDTVKDMFDRKIKNVVGEKNPDESIEEKIDRKTDEKVDEKVTEVVNQKSGDGLNI